MAAATWSCLLLTLVDDVGLKKVTCIRAFAAVDESMEFALICRVKLLSLGLHNNEEYDLPEAVASCQILGQVACKEGQRVESLEVEPWIAV